MADIKPVACDDAVARFCASKSPDNCRECSADKDGGLTNYEPTAELTDWVRRHILPFVETAASEEQNEALRVRILRAKRIREGAACDLHPEVPPQVCPACRVRYCPACWRDAPGDRREGGD